MKDRFDKSTAIVRVLIISLFLIALLATGLGISCYSSASAPPAASPGLPQETTPGAAPATPSTVEVAIEGFAFQPAEIKIAVGSTITWYNEDSAAHTVTARDKTFDSGSQSGGATFSYKFGEKGTFAYYCQFHPSMTGKVIVE